MTQRKLPSLSSYAGFSAAYNSNGTWLYEPTACKDYQTDAMAIAICKDGPSRPVYAYPRVENIVGTWDPDCIELAQSTYGYDVVKHIGNVQAFLRLIEGEVPNPIVVNPVSSTEIRVTAGRFWAQSPVLISTIFTFIRTPSMIEKDDTLQTLSARALSGKLTLGRDTGYVVGAVQNGNLRGIFERTHPFFGRTLNDEWSRTRHGRGLFGYARN